MKKIIAATAVAAALAAGSTQGANTPAQFNVVINLTARCTVTTPTDLTFNYTTLQGVVANATGGLFSVRCTDTLPYTFGLQAGNGAATPPGAASIAVTDAIVNLDYTLALSAAGGTGNGGSQDFNVTGQMVANQVGKCATSLPTCSNGGAGANRTHTLIVNY